MPQTLRISSPPFHFRLLAADVPHSATVDGWQLKEVLSPDSVQRGGDSYGDYTLVMEATLRHHSDYSYIFDKGVTLVDSIERLWPYAAGLPLRHHGFAVHLVPVDFPKGWISNAQEAYRLIQKETSSLTVGSISSRTVHYRSAEHFPLRSLLRARDAYATTDKVTQAIIALHFEGLMSGTEDGPHVLFAKALDIIRASLPGGDDRARQRALPEGIRASLTRDFHWLFDMANNRWNTRHPIARNRKLTLNPPMDGPESIAFLREADAVIRSVVCDRLGIEYVAIGY